MASNRGGGRGYYGQTKPNVGRGGYSGGRGGRGSDDQYRGGSGGGYDGQYRGGGGYDGQYRGGGGYDGQYRGGGGHDGQYRGGSGGGYDGQYRGGGGRGRGRYQGRGDGRGRGRDSRDPGYYGQHHVAGPSRATSDLPQAGPSLADRCAAAAAEMKEKFQNLDIKRTDERLPARPGFGTLGRPCSIKANHFFVNLADKGLNLYDVSITPESTVSSVYRAVMSKLVSEYQQSHLGGRLPAYDGRKCLYTAGSLPFISEVFEITLVDGERREKKFNVTIKHAKLVSVEQLHMLMAGYHTDIPAQALQALDIVLRDVIMNEQNNEFVVVGRSFFSPHLGVTIDLGVGLMAWKGFYQSIRPTQMGLSLNIDMSSTAFIQPLPLIEYVQRVLNRNITGQCFTDVELIKIKRALRGLRIEVTHRGNARRKYRISGLTKEVTRDLKFESSAGVTNTVKDYFRETYRLHIRYDFLPCLQVGNDKKPTYLPMEVCEIVSGQRYQKKLEESQATALIKSTCQRPYEREKSIRQAVEGNKYNSAQRAIEFGIEVDNQPVTAEARVLPPPNLKYHNSGAEKECLPSGGAWNMRNKKVVNGAKITRWACINFCQDISESDVRQFCFELAKMSRVTGLDFADLRLAICTAQSDQVENVLKNRCRNANLELLVAILPDKNGNLYGNLKKVCETDIGLVSQCCRRSNVLKMNPQYLANVALKINAKVGGRNSVFANIPGSLPVVSNRPTIIFGADVTHPSALEDSTPSIASVVATKDWPEVTKYNGLVHAQGHREELISGLEGIVRELLLSFEKECKQRPQQLIFYRDGVSDGQFNLVLNKEIPEIEKAWKSLYNERPPITFIVVQKRHHTRLFPNNYNDGDKTGNVLPGTVVDRRICHPTEFDFYLCSHAGIQGTNRPTHYHVLRDDNKFSADSLQSLTNNLCYTYASCTRSVSIAPPAYYAHKLAFRARFYLDQGSDAGSSAGRASGSHPAAVRPLSELKDSLKNLMFYC